MSNRKVKNESTRQAILTAALSLFGEQGFHATSVREIAHRAGINQSSIYNYFENKDQIFETVFLEMHPYQDVFPHLKAAPGDTMEELLRNAAHLISGEIEKRPEYLQLVIIELNEFRGRHVSTLMQRMLPQFIPLIRRIERTPSQLRNLPPQTIVLAFAWMFFAHYLFEKAIDPDGQLFQRAGALDNYLEIFLHGILSPKP